jgi:hypothetical protein
VSIPTIAQERDGASHLIDLDNPWEGTDIVAAWFQSLPLAGGARSSAVALRQLVNDQSVEDEDDSPWIYYRGMVCKSSPFSFQFSRLIPPSPTSREFDVQR